MELNVMFVCLTRMPLCIPGRRDDLTVSALDSGSSVPGLSLGRGTAFCFGQDTLLS